MKEILNFRIILRGIGNQQRLRQAHRLIIGADQMNAIEQGFTGFFAFSCGGSKFFARLELRVFS